MAPRATPAENGLTASPSPLSIPVTGQLGALVDQAVSGNPTAQAQLAAMQPALLQGEQASVRQSLDANGRRAREPEQQLPTPEQFAQLEREIMGATNPLAQLQPAAPAPLVPPPPAPLVPPMGAPPPAPPAPAPAQKPEWQAAIEALTQQTQAQQAILNQWLETQLQAQQPPPPRELSRQEKLAQAQAELMAQGYARERITPEMLVSYVVHQDNAALQQRLDAVERAQEERWNRLGSEAQQIQLNRAIENSIQTALQPYNNVPAPTRALIASNVRAQAQAGVPLEQAVQSSLAGILPFLQQPQAPAAPAQQPFAPLAPPPMAPLYQVPAYAGMSQQQLMSQQQAMSAAALQGAGANRYTPQGPSLDALDRAYLSIRN